MTKEEKEYVLTALHFALDNGDFVDEDIETAYNTLNNSITVIEKEFVSEDWIKIESEDDLPKEFCACWVQVQGVVINVPLYYHPVNKTFTDNMISQSYTHFSHYQKNIKPEPPVY